MRRVFFALWPDQSKQKEIWSAFTSSSVFFSHKSALQKSKLYSTDNLHLTLHFLGNVTDEVLNCVLTEAADVTAKSFTLDLNTYGSFYKARVLWMSPEVVPAELTGLYDSLSTALKSCGMKVDDRKYNPHVSLVRKLNFKLPPEKTHSLTWDVKRFALVESVPIPGGVIYKPVKIYNLTK